MTHPATTDHPDGYACGLCWHEVKIHNLSQGCPVEACRCMATPGEANRADSLGVAALGQNEVRPQYRKEPPAFVDGNWGPRTTVAAQVAVETSSWAPHRLRAEIVSLRMALIEANAKTRETVAGLDKPLVATVAEALWESIDDKGIEGRLFRKDCDYLAKVAVKTIRKEA